MKAANYPNQKNVLDRLAALIVSVSLWEQGAKSGVSQRHRQYWFQLVAQRAALPAEHVVRALLVIGLLLLPGPRAEILILAAVLPQRLAVSPQAEQEQLRPLQ